MTEASSTTTDMATSSMPSELDLAFIIDATGSMGCYIRSAQENMRNIIQNIIVSERCLLRVALILYRDHPPQENTFIIQLHDFTDDVEQSKKHIDSASAHGGGDGPEAIAPALHAAVHTLSWRKNSVKIAVLIADAPPHGLERSGDHWPDGDPSGYDPMVSVAELAERHVTLYSIGCEPAIASYRDFFMALAFKTGGQYIPLGNSSDLGSVIVGSAREEISLEKLIAQVHEEVMREAVSRGGPVDEVELTRRIHDVMTTGGVKARRVKVANGAAIPQITPAAEYFSTLKTLKEVQDEWLSRRMVHILPTTMPTMATPAFGRGKVAPRRAPKLKAPRARAPVVKKAPVKRKAPTPVVTTIKKKPGRKVTRGARRSIRMALNGSDTEDEEVPTDVEIVEAPSPPKRKAKRPSKPQTKLSIVHLEDDELLDISQTRRLVRKCVARNKL